jgi:hypothetical protein
MLLIANAKEDGIGFVSLGQTIVEGLDQFGIPLGSNLHKD